MATNVVSNGDDGQMLPEADPLPTYEQPEPTASSLFGIGVVLGLLATLFEAGSLLVNNLARFIVDEDFVSWERYLNVMFVVGLVPLPFVVSALGDGRSGSTLSVAFTGMAALIVVPIAYGDSTIVAGCVGLLFLAPLLPLAAALQIARRHRDLDPAVVTLTIWLAGSVLVDRGFIAFFDWINALNPDLLLGATGLMAFALTIAVMVLWPSDVSTSSLPLADLPLLENVEHELETVAGDEADMELPVRPAASHRHVRVQLTATGLLLAASWTLLNERSGRGLEELARPWTVISVLGMIFGVLLLVTPPAESATVPREQRLPAVVWSIAAFVLVAGALSSFGGSVVRNDWSDVEIPYDVVPFERLTTFTIAAAAVMAFVLVRQTGARWLASLPLMGVVAMLITRVLTQDGVLGAADITIWLHLISVSRLTLTAGVLLLVARLPLEPLPYAIAVSIVLASAQFGGSIGSAIYSAVATDPFAGPFNPDPFLVIASGGLLLTAAWWFFVAAPADSQDEPDLSAS